MGVKSTTALLRSEAETKFIEMVEEHIRHIRDIPDEALCDLLEALNDALAVRELNHPHGFDNFMIVTPDSDFYRS